MESTEVLSFDTGEIGALDRPVMLIGEIHDHPQQHALRLAAFDAALAAGARPALVMEQLDAPPSDKKKIFELNARTLFRLPSRSV